MICSKSRSVLIVFLLILSIVPVALADEPAGVKLMRPDCLAGWDCADPAPAGWTITEGKLSARKGATPLVSAWTFGDFQLRFEWSVAGGGQCKLTLPEVPDGNRGLELVLCEGDGCGRLLDGGKQLAPGVKVEPVKIEPVKVEPPKAEPAKVEPVKEEPPKNEPAKADKMHTAHLSRVGGKLSLEIDGKQIYQVDLKPGRRLGLGLAVTEGEAAVARMRVEEPTGGSIFNGKDLAGWWTPGNMKAWAADSGHLMLKGQGGNYLRTEKEYGNFTLSFEYKSKKHCNSGVGIRTPRTGWPSGDGMELQIEDKPGMDKHSTMAVYGNMPPLARADKSEQWNRVVIKADGRMVSAWVNGELVQQCNTFQHPELKHRFLKGWIGLQDHGSWIRYRNLHVLQAPAGPGLDAWRKPAQPLATTTLLDRLMNPEQLAALDGLTSGVVAKNVSDDKKGQHVLAELTGPGALVRIARSNDQGRLAFFFDGEAKPRIDCQPKDLRGALPQLAEDANPVPTCLTYKKSLKIVLRDAGQAGYRFDYVSFPKNLPVESFVDTHSGFPRGWLSAVVYRYHRCRWGASREVSPLGELHGEQMTIAPCTTETLAHVDGSGIVRWVKLLVDKKALQNDDLHLEVTVDGEKQPAISAPARFWLPGLIDMTGYYNFVLIRSGGPTNMLAMPYSAGITFSVKNTGIQPIGGVGLILRIAPADASNRALIDSRMRLRGVFQPAGEGSNDLIHQKGNGRWVGFVYQQPEGDPTGIAQLVVDGKPVGDWSAANLDSFIGAAGNSRTALGGRIGSLAWRYLMLAPVEFRKSLVLKANTKKLGDRLSLFYAR